MSSNRLFNYLLVGVVVLDVISSASGKRILVVPFLNTSHTLVMHTLTSRLLSRGHSISVLWAREFPQEAITRTTRFSQHTNYSLLEFPLGLSPDELAECWRAAQENFLSQQQVDTALAHTGWFARAMSGFESGRATIRRAGLWSKIVNALCRAVLADERLMKRLRDSAFDIALVDDFFAARCFFLIPHALGVPFVSVGEMSSWWDMRLPVLPASLVGPEVSTVSLADRLTSLAFFILKSTIVHVPTLKFYDEENLRLGNVSSVWEFLSLPSQSALFLHLWDDLLTGYSLPKLPHVEVIGGVTAGPAKQLDDSDLKQWADAARDGFVVCSFGSILSAPSEQMIEKLFHLFSELRPFPVVFKLCQHDLTESLKSKVAENVRLMDWLPQSDLLGHPNARLFITHAGTNGYSEALYHGVPMLAFPLVAPQKFMAMRIEALGYGKQASLITMNGTDLAALAKALLTDRRYQEKVRKISKIIQARKHPGDVAADAIEHVLEFGSEHLRPHASYQLNVIQFYMLDVLLLLCILIVFFITITIFIIISGLKCIWRCTSKFLLKPHIKTKAD